MLFEQGDLIEVDFNPTVGHEPAKRTTDRKSVV